MRRLTRDRGDVPGWVLVTVIGEVDGEPQQHPYRGTPMSAHASNPAGCQVSRSGPQ